MSWDLANIVGLIGSAIMVVAYGYSNAVKHMNMIFFNLLNLVGAALLISSLLVHFNLASFLLEVVWAMIAAGGLATALVRKARA